MADETSEIGRSPASQGRATGLRPQPAAPSSQSSVPNAALLDLAERVEKATGSNPDLGREVLLACGWRKSQVGYFLGPLYHWSPPEPYRRGAGFDDDKLYLHNPMSSLDAARKLLAPGTLWCVGSMEDGPFARLCWPMPDGTFSGGYFEATAATATGALVAACLRARAATSEIGRVGCAETGPATGFDPARIQGRFAFMRAWLGGDLSHRFADRYGEWTIGGLLEVIEQMLYMGWARIESAPHCVPSGIEHPGDNGRRPVLVTRWPVTGAHHPVAVARLTSAGWISGKRGTKLWFEPTHWQPLPGPPYIAAGEGQ